MHLRGAFSDREANHPILFGVMVTLVCVALGAGSRAVIDPIVDGVPFMTFFAAVALATYVGGQYAGISTMLLGGVIAAHFWVPPLNSLALARDQWITVAIYAVLSGLLVALIHRLHLAVTRAEAAEQTANLYASEMVHRTANLVTLVQSVASLTFRSDDCPAEQRGLFSARLAALGGALTAPMNKDGNQDVLSVVRTALLPFGEQVHVSGHSIGVRPEAAAKLALIFHELGTNAAKYGALSSEAGRVNVASSMTDTSLVIDWWERGGPEVGPQPSRRGFGTRLLMSSLSKDTGSVRIQFDPQGLTAEIVLKESQLIAASVVSVDSSAHTHVAT